MRGHIYFMVDKAGEGTNRAIRRKFRIEELKQVLAAPKPPGFRVVVPLGEERKYSIIPKETKRVRQGSKIVTIEVEGAPAQIAVDGQPVSLNMMDELQKLQFSEVEVYLGIEVVCEELCGVGHTKMPATILVLEQDDFKRRFETPRQAGGGGPATAPTQP